MSPSRQYSNPELEDSFKKVESLRYQVHTKLGALKATSIAHRQPSLARPSRVSSMTSNASTELPSKAAFHQRAPVSAADAPQWPAIDHNGTDPNTTALSEGPQRMDTAQYDNNGGNGMLAQTTSSLSDAAAYVQGAARTGVEAVRQLTTSAVNAVVGDTTADTPAAGEDDYLHTNAGNEGSHRASIKTTPAMLPVHQSVTAAIPAGTGPKVHFSDHHTTAIKPGSLQPPSPPPSQPLAKPALLPQEPTGVTTPRADHETDAAAKKAVMVERVRHATRDIARMGRDERAAGGGKEGREERAGGPKLRSGRKEEAVEGGREDWVSELVENLWPYIHDVLQDMTWEMLPPMLNDSKPSWIHGLELVKCEFGRREPDILAVRCYTDDNDIMEDVFLDMDLEWESEQDVEIRMEVLGKNIVSFVPDLLEAQLAKMMTMTIGVENAKLKGTLRLALRPLFRRIPIVGAIQVAFTEVPEFDFVPTVVGGPLGTALNALLPAVKGWLTTTIRDAAFLPYTLPEHYFYQLDPEAADLDRPLGILHCRVIEAKKVPKMDVIGATDGFVEVFIRNSEKHRTEVVAGKCPKWDEVFVMPVHVPEHQKLRFVLWDEDALFPNDEIGRTELSLSSLPTGEVHDLWLDVTSQDEEERKKAKEGGTGAGKKSRAIMKVAAPMAGHSTKDCQLHVRVMWRTWNDEEQQLLKEVGKKGIKRALQSPQAASIDPELKKLLWSGLVHVTVHRCKGLHVSGLLMRPSVKAVVQIGDMKPKETSPVKVSRKGHCQITGAPVTVDVDGATAERNDTQVVVTLKESGFMSGADEVGRVSFPLRQLMERKSVRQEWEAAGGGTMEVEFKWQGIFA